MGERIDLMYTSEFPNKDNPLLLCCGLLATRVVMRYIHLKTIIVVESVYYSPMPNLPKKRSQILMCGLITMGVLKVRLRCHHRICHKVQAFPSPVSLWLMLPHTTAYWNVPTILHIPNSPSSYMVYKVHLLRPCWEDRAGCRQFHPVSPQLYNSSNINRSQNGAERTVPSYDSDVPHGTAPSPSHAMPQL